MPEVKTTNTNVIDGATTLHRLLGIPEDAHIVSIIGAGGKTSLLYMLAREAHAKGYRTVLTTTTHMHTPRENDMEIWREETAAELHRIWDMGMIAAAGTVDGHIRGFTPASPLGYHIFSQEADRIYIEADGAKRLPVKYPAAWEPVIGFRSDAVVLVAGLSALGQRLSEACQRYDLAIRALKRQDLNGDTVIDEELMADILIAGYVRYEPTVLLNQADDPERIGKGQKVRALLLEKGLSDIVVSSLINLNGGPVYSHRDGVLIF